MVEIKGGGGVSGPVEARVCEGSTLDISCDEGTIDLIDATYGRAHGPDVCPHSATSDQSCHAVNSMDIVGAACQDQASCSVGALNSVFGDPCGGTYKYLTVNYVCAIAQATPEQVGCADGSREGFLDIGNFPKIAACATGYQGLAGGGNTAVNVADAGLSGNLNRADTGAPICADGWHVCSGADINSGRNDATHHTGPRRRHPKGIHSIPNALR
jgi:hypothetical protein